MWGLSISGILRTKNSFLHILSLIFLILSILSIFICKYAHYKDRNKTYILLKTKKAEFDELNKSENHNSNSEKRINKRERIIDDLESNISRTDNYYEDISFTGYIGVFAFIMSVF